MYPQSDFIRTLTTTIKRELFPPQNHNTGPAKPKQREESGKDTPRWPKSVSPHGLFLQVISERVGTPTDPLL